MATNVGQGWFPDPSSAASWRWWDGTQWTERTAPANPPTAFSPCTALSAVISRARARAGSAGAAATSSSGTPAVELPLLVVLSAFMTSEAVAATTNNPGSI